MQKSIELPDFNLILDARKALIHRSSSSLILSDLHIGKQAHLRKNGLALPNYNQQSEFLRIKTLVSEYAIQQIIYAGDLFHSSHNKETQEFIQNILSLGIPQILVQGNHDLIQSIPPEISVVQNFQLGVLQICHQREDAIENSETRLIISGHIHPGITMGKGKLKYRLPCFHLSNNGLTIPAFGDTTGIYIIRPLKSDKVWAILEDENLLYGLQ